MVKGKIVFLGLPGTCFIMYVLGSSNMPTISVSPDLYVSRYASRSCYIGVLVACRL